MMGRRDSYYKGVVAKSTHNSNRKKDIRRSPDPPSMFPLFEGRLQKIYPHLGTDLKKTFLNMIRPSSGDPARNRWERPMMLGYASMVKFDLKRPCEGRVQLEHHRSTRLELLNCPR